MSNLFAHLAGRKTVAVNASRGGHIYGVFNPAIPSTNFNSARYGVSDRTAPSSDHPFGEEMSTGFVYGPEGTGTIGGPGDAWAQGLQAAINHGALAGAPWNIPATAQADADDWRDSLLIVGDRGDSSSVYGTVVKRDLDAWSAAHPPVARDITPPTPPTVPLPAPPTATPPVATLLSPSSPSELTSVLSQLVAAMGQISTLASSYQTLSADVAAIKHGVAAAGAAATSSVLDPASLSAILTLAQGGLASLSAAGLGTGGGGHWAILFRNLCNTVVSAEKGK